MHKFRITKYNPALRDKKGSYLKNEWTSMYDVGKVFDKKKFSIEDYLSIEQKYLTAITTIFGENLINQMKIKNIEKFYIHHECFEYYTQDLIDQFCLLNEKTVITKKVLTNILRLILRENIWARIETRDHQYIHFGYDYYMYTGIKNVEDSIIRDVERLGLFVEEFESPY